MGREINAEAVRNQAFGKPSLGKRGYSADEVDRYLQVIAAALDGRSRLSANDVHNVAFQKPPLGKRGYDEEEVDAFLDAIEDQLKARERPRVRLPTDQRSPPPRSLRHRTRRTTHGPQRQPPTRHGTRPSAAAPVHRRRAPTRAHREVWVACPNTIGTACLRPSELSSS